MATIGGRVATDNDLLRYAEYTPTSNQRNETDIDRRIVSEIYWRAFINNMLAEY